MSEQKFRIIAISIIFMLTATPIDSNAGSSDNNTVFIEKIGVNTILNDRINVSATYPGIFNLKNSTYLAMWWENTIENNTIDTRIIDITDNMKYNVTQEEATSNIIMGGNTSMVKTTKLYDNVILLTWKFRSGDNQTDTYLIGQFIRSIVNQTNS